MFETAVIVPTYNRAKYLDRCLRSLLAQKNYKNYEVICINDGSTDETNKVLEQYSDQVDILINERNMGLPFSLNKGIRFSKSQFIVRVDSDDYVSNNFLEYLTFAMKANPTFNAIACDYEVITSTDPAQIYNCAEKPIACGIMFRRDVLFDLGLYNENFLMHEDLELMQRFSKEYRIERLPIPLYRYRMHDENMTNNKAQSKHYISMLKNKEQSR
jgi:glycosyltransferase involved in cell wall biosynthesis